MQVIYFSCLTLLASSANALRLINTDVESPEWNPYVGKWKDVLNTFLETQHQTFDGLPYKVKNGRDFPLTLDSFEAATHVSKHNPRLQRAMKKFDSGEGLNIVVVGGSVTAGTGCKTPWPNLLQSFLQQMYGDIGAQKDKVHVINRAVGGSTSQLVLTRWSELQKDFEKADIVISEYNFNEKYGINPQGHYGKGQGHTRHAINTALVYQILTLPNKPAFLYFDLPCWKGEMSKKSKFTKSDSDLKCPAFEPKWTSGSAHVQTAKWFNVPLVWYPDGVQFAEDSNSYMDTDKHSKKHPSCYPGHHLMASMLTGILLQGTDQMQSNATIVADDVRLPPGTKDLKQDIECTTHPKMEAYAVQGEKAFPVISNNGWRFYEDVPGKPGWVAEKGAPAEIVFNIPVGKFGKVSIEYLQSYNDFGNATCQIGSNNLLMQGYWDEHISVLAYSSLHPDMPQGTSYQMRCASEGRKFKISSITSC